MNKNLNKILVQWSKLPTKHTALKCYEAEPAQHQYLVNILSNTQLLPGVVADSKSHSSLCRLGSHISVWFPACFCEKQLFDIWRCFLPQPHLTDSSVCTDDITQLTATRFPKGPSFPFFSSLFFIFFFFFFCNETCHLTMSLQVNPNIVYCW